MPNEYSIYHRKCITPYTMYRVPTETLEDDLHKLRFTLPESGYIRVTSTPCCVNRVGDARGVYVLHNSLNKVLAVDEAINSFGLYPGIEYHLHYVRAGSESLPSWALDVWVSNSTSGFSGINAMCIDIFVTPAEIQPQISFRTILLFIGFFGLVYYGGKS